MGPIKEVRREVKLGDSRIDFLVNKTFLEVKMPLIWLSGSKDNGISSQANSFERLIRHFKELSNSSRAIVLLCFLYNAPRFTPPKTEKSNYKIKEAVNRATRNGVETWQANCEITKKGVTLRKYFKLDI